MSAAPSPASRLRRLTAGLAISVALVASACTGTGATTTPSPSAAPTAAIDVQAEIDATIAGIKQAVTLYTSGDKQGALDAIAETYEEHFELVEDPLGDVDHDFMEQIEETIAVSIRAAINEGKPAAEVAALAATAEAALIKAKDLLK
jgi:hypothetical protein